VQDYCEKEVLPFRQPEEGDLLLACCDAIIAAQTAVIAAESFGIGTCYIGDIMENFETHRELFDLPRFTFPICLLCLGYPTKSQITRPVTERFDKEFIVFQDNYKCLNNAEMQKMFFRLNEQIFKGKKHVDTAGNIGQLVYRRKFGSQFATEMNRSVRVILRRWIDGK
jgi:FMN reductase (NADPH)/FMN reductase [NAD(P)H]